MQTTTDYLSEAWKEHNKIRQISLSVCGTICNIHRFQIFLQENDDQSDKHVPSDFCVVTTSIFQDHNYEVFCCFARENVMDEFFAHMKREEHRICAILSVNVTMNDLTPE